MEPTLPLPDFNADGHLGSGLYLASLEEVLARFGAGTLARERQGALVRLIVERTRRYPTIKRSFTRCGGGKWSWVKLKMISS